MTSVKLSPKGKALRKNRWLSSRVVRAIVMDDDNQLYSEEGLKVYDENGKFLLTVKGATGIKKPARNILKILSKNKITYKKQ